jgi:hypothetical protein
MTDRQWSASYRCGSRLLACGCPLDYPEVLPGALRKSFFVRELGGWLESRVIALGIGTTGYVICLHLGTDMPQGVIISDWSFDPPWPDHEVCWDYEPREILLPRDRASYEKVDDGRLTAVLNDRRLLSRGRAVQGLLCGAANNPIPKAATNAEFVEASLKFIIDTGTTAILRIHLAVEQSKTRIQETTTVRRVRP